MVCRLCHQDKELVDSHVLPEFLHKPLYHPNQRIFIEMSTDERESNRILQKGLREKLLCKECESVFSGYEKYVSELRLEGMLRMPLTEREVIVNVDYLRFRLFVLSILWRTSISSLDFFKTIRLSPAEEERVRQMLIRGEPGEPDDFGVFLVGLRDEGGDPIVDLILAPDFVIVGGAAILRFVMAGFCWMFCSVAHLGQSPNFSKYFLDESGRLYVVSRKDALIMIDSFGKRVTETGKVKNAIGYLNRVPRRSKKKRK